MNAKLEQMRELFEIVGGHYTAEYKTDLVLETLTEKYIDQRDALDLIDEVLDGFIKAQKYNFELKADMKDFIEITQSEIFSKLDTAEELPDINVQIGNQRICIPMMAEIWEIFADALPRMYEAYAG